MKTILVVDAESASSGVGDVLMRCGFRGMVASTAYAALDIIRRDPSIDLVVAELQFPDMDGLRFLTTVRSIRQDLPVIVVTSCCSIESYLHAVNLGVYEYLNKPVISKELVRIVNVALSGQRPASLMHDAS